MRCCNCRQTGRRQRFGVKFLLFRAHVRHRWWHTRDTGKEGGDMLELLFPKSCAGCGAAGVSLCASCQEELRRVPHRVSCTVDPRVPVWALSPYAGAHRQLVISMKERGRRDAGSGGFPCRAGRASIRSGPHSGAGPNTRSLSTVTGRRHGHGGVCVLRLIDGPVRATPQFSAGFCGA